MLLDNPFWSARTSPPDAGAGRARHRREREADRRPEMLSIQELLTQNRRGRSRTESKQDWLDDWDGDGADAPSDREWGRWRGGPARPATSTTRRARRPARSR